MGEDTTEALGQGATQRDGDVTGRDSQEQPAAAAQLPGLLLAEQDVDDALALLAGADEGLAGLACAEDARVLPGGRELGDALSLLEGASDDYARLLRESAEAPDAAAATAAPGTEALDVAQAGERLRESARALLSEPEPEPGSEPGFELASGLPSGFLEGDEVEAALGALDTLEASEPAWAAAPAPGWRSQRPERLHAGAIEQRAQEEGGADAEDMDPLDTWYVAPAGTPQGPLTLQALRERWEAGAVGPDTPCWSGGMARWVPLSRVLKLAGALAPPLPRLSLEQVASSLRAPAAPPAPAFQPLAGGALRSLLAEEEARERSEAFARSEALARMQEARAAALAAYVPQPTPALQAAPERRRGGILVPALLGSALTALALTCALLGFSLLRAREGVAPQPAALLAAASAPAAAVQAGTVAGAKADAAPSERKEAASPKAGASRSTAAAGNKADASRAAAVAPGNTVKAGAVAAKGAATAEKRAEVVSTPAKRAVGGPAQARPQTAAASAQKPSAREALAAVGPTSTGEGTAPAADAQREAAAESGEVQFEEEEEEEAPAAEEQKAQAPLGPDEEFERALSAEEPPLEAGEADEADAAPQSSEVKAAEPAVPTTYVPPAPGAGPELRESLGQADVLETVLAHKTQVVACVDAQKKLQPGLAGKLVVRFSVLPDGTAKDVATETEELQGTPLAGCIEAAVASWRFPVHRVQGPAIRFPFTL